MDRYPACPFAIFLDHLSGILSAISLAIIMILRSSTTIRRQAILYSDRAAAVGP
jgi:hypothetical protein